MGVCWSTSRGQSSLEGGTETTQREEQQDEQRRDEVWGENGELQEHQSSLGRLSGESSIHFLTRHHRVNLYDVPYRVLHAGGQKKKKTKDTSGGDEEADELPKLSATASRVSLMKYMKGADASEQQQKKKKVSEKRKGVKAQDEEWMNDVAKRYELVSTLGVGGTSTVWLGRDSETREEVAIKILKRPISEKDMPMLYNEILIGSQSWLDNVIPKAGKLHDSMYLCHSKSVFLTQHCYGMVMEVAKGGNLAEYVSATCGTHVNSQGKHVPLAIDEDQARFIFKQVILGVHHMHSSMRTAHRDIKLDNTVIMDDAWMSHVPGKGFLGKSKTQHCPVGRVALIDFQFAYHWAEGSRLSRHKGLMGTPVYMSPELLALRFDTHKHAYDPVSSDIWACGIMLVAMLIGAFPFDDVYSGRKQTMADLEEAIYRLQKRFTWKESPTVKPYLKYISASCIDLIDGMLSFDPSKRSSMSKIQMHPWMKDFESKTFQEAWDRLQEQEQAQNIVEHKFDDESRTRIGKKLSSRNKAVMEMMHIACRPYQEDASILNPDECPDDVRRKELLHSVAIFESPDVAGLVNHHSFRDEHSLEISMGMEDILHTQG
jgi:serine/threonine protein kinase